MSIKIVLNSIAGTTVHRVFDLDTCSIQYKDNPYDLYQLNKSYEIPTLDRQGNALEGGLCLYVVAYLVHYNQYIVCDCLTDVPFIYSPEDVLELCRKHKVYGVNIKGDKISLVEEYQKLYNKPCAFDMTKFNKVCDTIQAKKNLLSLSDTDLSPHLLNVFKSVYKEGTLDYFYAIYEYNKRTGSIPGYFLVDERYDVAEIIPVYKETGCSMYDTFKWILKNMKMYFHTLERGASNHTCIVFCIQRNARPMSRYQLQRLNVFEIISPTYSDFTLNYYAYYNFLNNLKRVHIVNEKESTSCLNRRCSFAQMNISIPELPKAKEYYSWYAPNFGVMSDCIVFDDDTSRVFDFSTGYCGAKLLYFGKNIQSISEITAVEFLPRLQYVVVNNTFARNMKLLQTVIGTDIIFVCPRNSRQADYIRFLQKESIVAIVEHTAETIEGINTLLQSEGITVDYSPETEQEHRPVYKTLNGTKWKKKKGTLHVCYVRAEVSAVATADDTAKQYHISKARLSEQLFNDLTLYPDTDKYKVFLDKHIGVSGETVMQRLLPDSEVLFGLSFTPSSVLQKRCLCCMFSFFTLTHLRG